MNAPCHPKPPFCKRIELGGPQRRPSQRHITVAEHPGRIYLALHGPLCTMGMSLGPGEARTTRDAIDAALKAIGE